MSSDRSVESESDLDQELPPELDLDYRKARPNRFAAPCPPGGRVVVLEPDVAGAFPSAEAVNAALRSLIPSMPATGSTGG